MKIRLLSVLLSLGCCLPVAATESTPEATVTYKYEWLSNGVKSGSLELTVNKADRTRLVAFEFNDRGRGPRLSELTRFDASGQVAELRISGSSYMGAAVDERFQRDADAQRWSSTLENGSTERSGAFYLANDGTPEQTAQLARALLASEGASLELLPNGQVSISKLDEISKSAASTTTRLSLYSLSGISMDPHFIWLDQNQELFGLVSGSSVLLPEGWSGLATELQGHQEKAELKYYQARSQPLTHHLPDRYAITNVNVVDVESGTLLENRVVQVAGGKVLSINGSTPPDEDVLLIDGKGGTLLPGLWDMHTHISTQDGLLHMAGGVTTIRDMGNNPESYREVKRQFDQGEVIGPRSFAAGILERKSPYAAPIKNQAESLQDALDLVDSYAAMGYPQIKVYSSVEPDWIKPIAGRTHGHGMRLSGHIPSFMTAERAVNDGYNEVQHINMLFLNFLAGPEDDTRTPLRFSLVAEKGGDLDLDSDAVNTLIALLKQHQVVVDPTVAIFDNMFRHRSGSLSPSFAMVADHFPPAVKRRMYAGRMNINEENAGTYAASADALLRMLYKLHDSGIHIVAGTDSLPGFGLHRELELYVQAGIPTANVLRLATLGAAKLMKASATSGSITAGKDADFVLLGSNPLADISAIRSTRMVFKGDRYFVPSEMYRAVGIKPFQGNE